MGSVCCAARDTTMTEANGEILRRTIQYSPSWGVRWDNRGRVAGEETPVSVIVENVRRNNPVDSKSEPPFEANPHKSLLMSEDVGTQSEAHVSESPEPQKVMLEVEKKTCVPAALEPNVPHTALEGRSPLRPVSIFESTQALLGGSLDNWSIQNFPESTTSTHRDTLSVEGELFDSHRHKLVQSHSRKSESHSNELETCMVCSRYLLEKSSFSSQKILPNNELSVVAILICGHVYHADCLDHLTPEINKYDPQCPICTFGEQNARSTFEKLLKEELDLKRKKHWSRIGNSDIIPLRHESTSKLESSPSLRSSFSRPFLKRHISFRSKADSSSSETQLQQVRRILLPWSKSSK